MEIQNRAALVRLLICDVDGTLTDGRLLLGPGGVEFKQFHVHDGYGLRQVMDAGIEVAIVSGRDSIVVTERMQALGVRYIHQGVGDKLAVVSELIRQLGLSLAQVCFVGDDEPDAPVMRRVGLGVAVANAHPSALAAAHCRTDLRGGHGAVREVCELLMRAQRPTTRGRSLNRWLAALALALLAALSFWLAERITTTTAPAPALPRVPDYTLDDMERTLLDDMGQVAQIIRARHVTRYEREDITELVAPSMELYNDEGQPWHVIADEGTVTENGDLIMLTGAVEIWRLDAAGQRELEIRTTGLRVLPDEQFAESATLTTITTPDSVTRSIGMRADLATRRVELLEQVRTRYEKAD